MNRPDERAPRTRREVPTVRAFVALVIVIPSVLAIVLDLCGWSP